ncbi:hypothetical protein K458DRAFT_132923 [Lentithecium fluviatile CBS 122367]|uniref:Uncharacterized protein n=1 Tax=Lentithecium fluviatile CBS 122367 TaxID=1168545 RepID=A0A6G1IL03_9PLEO|nr:hypothetical protein K458DRAFT_132923 [Lentithecium fluviatile CBS 122367]
MIHFGCGFYYFVSSLCCLISAGYRQSLLLQPTPSTIESRRCLRITTPQKPPLHPFLPGSKHQRHTNSNRRITQPSSNTSNLPSSIFKLCQYWHRHNRSHRSRSRSRSCSIGASRRNELRRRRQSWNADGNRGCDGECGEGSLRIYCCSAGEGGGGELGLREEGFMVSVLGLRTLFGVRDGEC